MNHQFYLFCKSYLGDLQRVKNLWASIQAHNKDNIPFFISVPHKERAVFESEIKDERGVINWISDEEIVLLNPSSQAINNYNTWDGRLSQQVIKSEFWRVIEDKGLGSCSYLCIDSESVFIRDFYLSNFMFSITTPYTVLHQNKDLIQLALNKKISKVAQNFFLESEKLKSIFNRIGPNYDFGPTPVIWSSEVWKSLEQNYLHSNNMSIWDAIKKMPSELRWYGEALLKYRKIDLHPIEPIFRVYHYNWQYFHLKQSGETEENLRENYLGLLLQSNWNFKLDYGYQAQRKSLLSRLNMHLKQYLARFR